MFEVYTKYALPVLIIGVLSIAIIRGYKKYSINDDSDKKIKAIKRFAISVTITFLLITSLLIKILK